VNKVVFFVLSVIPLAPMLLGVGGYLPESWGNAKIAGVPVMVVGMLGLLVWLVLLASWYLNKADRGVAGDD